MIGGTPWSPAIAFVRFARDFIRHVASGDFAGALQPLDASDPGMRWSKARLTREMQQSIDPSSVITSPDGLLDSARASLTELSPGQLFELEHRLPLDGKWSQVAAVFRFSKAKGGFKTALVGFRRLP
ncbi:MAG TPA: hypothetical protein VN380_22405 [Thermoanaerobaculia bacterium]|nr:hypothetical protein [Thermoanaerobaculia bacterium]